MVSKATTAATTARMGTGARNMIASTIGIRTTAVAMRLSKGSEGRAFSRAATILARIEEFHHTAAAIKDFAFARRRGSARHIAARVSDTRQSLRADVPRENRATA